MAFQIFASPQAGDNTLVSVERADLGDPRKVKFHPTVDAGVKYEDYFRFARQLFSTENIRNNPGIFGQRSTGNPAASTEVGTAFAAKFLEKVPEDLHEYGFLISIYHDNWDDREVDQRLALSFDSYANVLYGQNYAGQSVRLLDDAYWTGVVLFLSSVKDFFGGSVWRVVKHLPTTHQTATPTNAFFYAARLMNNTRYITRCTSESAIAHGSVINAADAIELLGNNSTEIRLTLTTNGYLLVCPVSIVNKSSLYQLFNASTDVTSILGKGTPPKKTVVKNNKTTEVKAVNQKLYGVELELATDKTVRQMIDAQGDPVRFLCKADGSITGSKKGRYECVTIPMSMSEHRTLWTRFFANIGSKTDFDVSTQTNNGMHVHIGRNLFTDKHLKNFAWFITAPEHREFILQLSQRTQESFDRWSPCPKYNTMVSHLKAYNNCVTSVSGLRGAVNVGNTRNKPTVEVRIFKGIVSCAEVLRNLEVVDSIFEFTRPVTEGGHCTYQTLTIDNYYNWVKSTPKTQYKLLRADLWKLDIPMLVRKAKTLRIIFNLTDPEKIVEKVNAAKKRTASEKDESKRFEIDKIVFAAVTRVIGRRAFGMTDDGELTIIQKPVGRIAHMDEKLIQSYDKRVKAGH